MDSILYNDPKYPDLVQLMIEGDTEGWRVQSWSHQIRIILDTTRQNTDAKIQASTVDLIHRLGARGYFEFRNLLPKISAS